jgi:hypothetical protein
MAKVFERPLEFSETNPDAQTPARLSPLSDFNHKYVMLHRNGIKQAPC